METQNHYFTTPFKNDYLLALGRATATFAALEWNVVYLIVGLDEGKWIRKIEKRTAGDICKVLSKAITETKLVLSGDIVSRLQVIAEEFGKAVLLRNSLLHGNPATSPTTSEPAIIGKDGEWTINRISEVTITFQELSARANALYYERFK